MATQRVALEVCERCEHWQVRDVKLGHSLLARPREEIDFETIEQLIGRLSRFNHAELQIIRECLNGMLGE